MVDNSDVLIGGETINADSIGLDQRISSKKKKQYMIIGAIALTIVILAVIIVVIITTSGSKEEKKEDPVPAPTDKPDSDEDDHDPSTALGEINAYYNVKSTDKPIIILSPNFVKTSSFSIYIDDKYVKFTKEYTFPKKNPNQNVKFLIYEDISLETMFKGVKDLLSVQITSTKNLKITSMISAFEDCEQLSSFNINGCDTSQVISVKNLFRNTDIRSLDIAGLSLTNIKDMSYMFANSKLQNIDLSKLNTQNVENMAGMFQGDE